MVAIVLYSFFQQYLVFSADTLTLDFHYKSTLSEKRASDTEVTAEIVKDEAGKTNHGTGSVNASELQAMYVPYSHVSEEGISSYLISLEANEGNAVILQMKPASGNLVWESSVKLSTSYGTSGTTSMRSIINSLHEDNIYVVADISCFLDTAMASRNTALALTNEENKAYSDSDGTWLDPYNKEVQDYLAALIEELCSLGFDEIMLSNYCFPIEGTMGDRSARASADNTDIPDGAEPDNSAGGSNDDSTAADNAGGDDDTGTSGSAVYYVKEKNPAAISVVLTEFANELSELTSNYRTALSVRLDDTVLRGNLEEQTGQNPSKLEPCFSRLYCDIQDEYRDADIEQFEELLGDDFNSRFVPIMRAPTEEGSWAVR